MARLRYTLEQARARAERLAVDYAADQAWWNERMELLGAQPVAGAVQGTSSKHPTVWSIGFKPRLPGTTVMDGGDVWVRVDLETESVVLTEWP